MTLRLRGYLARKKEPAALKMPVRELPRDLTDARVAATTLEM
jgi:hypothetical protein